MELFLFALQSQKTVAFGLTALAIVRQLKLSLDFLLQILQSQSQHL